MNRRGNNLEFQGCCLKNIWFTRGDEELGTSGAQIDLLIERRDRIINICEIKFSSDEFVIDKEYDLQLRNKIEAFKRNTSTKYGLQLTMLTTYGVKNNKYSSIMGNQITLEYLFDVYNKGLND